MAINRAQQTWPPDVQIVVIPEIHETLSEMAACKYDEHTANCEPEDEWLRRTR